MPSGDWNEGDILRVVSDFLNEIGGFLDNFVETFLAPLEESVAFEFNGGLKQRSYLGSVHLVDSDDELPDTKGESK